MYADMALAVTIPREQGWTNIQKINVFSSQPKEGKTRSLLYISRQRETNINHARLLVWWSPMWSLPGPFSSIRGEEPDRIERRKGSGVLQTSRQRTVTTNRARLLIWCMCGLPKH
jgi:hypothetical protein